MNHKNNSKEDIKKFYNKFHKNQNHLLNRVMEDLRYKFLRNEVSKYSGDILVIGCGSKREMTLVNPKKYKKIIGIDISKTAIEKTKKRFPKYHFEVMDACNMTFDENSFDIVVCSEVIEHLPDSEGFLDSVVKILRKNGVFVLTTPNWWSFYGLARYVAEAITNRPFTADNQPIDNWAYPNKLINNLKRKKFIIKKVRGLWFLPPFGRGDLRLPGLITYPIYILFYPFEKLFSVMMPKFGQMIAITMINKKK